MLVRGPDFMVGAHARDGVIVKADRVLAFAVGWPIDKFLARADRWGWRVDLSAEERAQLANGGTASRGDRRRDLRSTIVVCRSQPTGGRSASSTSATARRALTLAFAPR